MENKPLFKGNTSFLVLRRDYVNLQFHAENGKTFVNLYTTKKKCPVQRVQFKL